MFQTQRISELISHLSICPLAAHIELEIANIQKITGRLLKTFEKLFFLNILRINLKFLVGSLNLRISYPTIQLLVTSRFGQFQTSGQLLLHFSCNINST
jgi:hypothetical protein